MKRFYYEGNTKTTGREVDGVYRFSEQPLAGYNVFDRRRGSAHQLRMAFCYDRDNAEKIVAALNAAVKNDA